MTSEITPKELSDVPKDVMDKVYVKWSNALEVATVDNWWACRLWEGCALCDWLRSGCISCPLVADRWCQRIDRVSRLHIVYHDNIDDWRADIIKFLEYVKPYCSDDIDA
jgi:hypothetical protein